MNLIKKTIKPNGRVHIYLLGVKVFSYKKNSNHSNTQYFDSRLKTACDIGLSLNELHKKNIQIMYPVGVVISSRAKLGNNVKIYQNVTIGAKCYENYRIQNYPEIGDNCIIYAGAVICGDVKIGENCVIGANSVVLHDCEANSVYVGIPAKKIKNYNQKAEQQAVSWLSSENICFAKFANSNDVKKLNKSSICIDCGANIGKVSEIMAKTGAKVYAFEPNPLCMEQLESVCSKYKNIELIKKGVADKNKKFKMFHNDFIQYDREVFSQSSSIYATKKNVNAKNYTEIECIDLCEFIKNLNKTIDILKMDIEGAEFDILYKLITRGIYKKIKHILVETHDDSIPEIADIAKTVRQLIKDKNINNINLTWC